MSASSFDALPSAIERPSQGFRAMASTDRDALVALFRATGGNTWKRNANWNTRATLSRWHGVDVNDQGHVVRLVLDGNNLQGTIPKELGQLTALTYLYLRNNGLKGEIPASLGQLSKLERLCLDGNRLRGTIPKELANLTALEYLRLDDNALTGTIPKELGTLTALACLSLRNNGLTGTIPKELGNLTSLEHLGLHENSLTGEVPVSLGQLGKLERLWLEGNQLSGTIPKDLGNLTALEYLGLQQAGGLGERPWGGSWLSVLGFHENGLPGEGLTGGPAENESLASWRARLRPQQEAERDEEQEKVPVRRSSPTTQGGEARGSNAAPIGGTSFSQEGEDAEHLLRAQVASFASLEELTRNNGESLEEVKLLIETSPTGSFTYGAKFSDTDKLRELDRLAEMAKALCEVASSHMEDKNVQHKELALPPDLKAYYTTVRTGLCNAYLAASVVGSSLVCTSKTGGMGTAGKALKLLSGAVPLVGGLAGFAAAALTAGDRYIQTKRVTKITIMAPDAVECCSLARTLALRLADGVADGTISTTYEVEEVRMRTMASIGGATGGSRAGQGVGPLLDGASEEDVMEWFVDEVASYEPHDDDARKSAPEVQAKMRLAKKHLHTLLKAVGRDCLQGTNGTEEKVERLLLVIFPEAKRRPASPLNSSEGSFIRSPVSAPSHDGSPGMMAKFAAMEAKMAEFAAMQAKMASLAAMEARMEALELENKNLRGKVTTMQKNMPKPKRGSTDLNDAGGGQVLLQEHKTKTKEEFWQEAEKQAAAAKGRTLTPDEHQAYTRELGAFVGELDNRVGNIEPHPPKGKRGGFLKRLRRGR